jgi:ketosteroid isomerase-like protein
MTPLPPAFGDAVAALNRGDVEPLVALLDPDLDWTGVRRGHLWWAHTPR